MTAAKWYSVCFRAFQVTAICTVPFALGGCGYGSFQSEASARNDYGGLLSSHVDKYTAMAARGERLVVDGACYSACTLAFGIVDVCATPRASFGFHMAQSLRGFGYAPDDYWTAYMMQHYPPEIRAWIMSKGGLTPDIKILRGAELSALVPTCPT
jgi:hypothetical protein